MVLDATHSSLATLKTDKEFEDEGDSYYTRGKIAPEAVVAIKKSSELVVYLRKEGLFNPFDENFGPKNSWWDTQSQKWEALKK